jgi:VWFA-related protein
MVVKVNTRLVLVDAIITDKAGNPITDLQQEEVEVLENGKPQKIGVMQLQRFEANGSTPLPQPKLPPGIFSNMPTVIPNDVPPTILLLDALNTPAADMMSARPLMVKYLQQAAAGQRIAIYLLDKHLRLLQDFTSDPAILRAALQYETSSRNPFRKNEDSITGDPNAGSYPQGLGSAVTSIAGATAAIAAFESQLGDFRETIACEITADALLAIANHAGGYPGRKNLIWVSSKFPLQQVADLDSSLAQGPCKMSRAAKALNMNQIAMYPVDARGLIASSPNQVVQDNQNIAASHIIMIQIARDTGGKALYNGNDLDHLVEHAVADGSTYYLFGYYPQEKKWDGRFRHIQVKVNRPGLEIRARKGYYADDPAPEIDVNSKRAKDDFGTALAYDQADWTQLPMDIQVVPGAETIVRFAVDGSALRWQPTADGGRHGNFSFVVFVYKKDKLVAKTEETADTKIRPEQVKLLTTGLPFEQKLTIAPGRYLLKAAVRDNRSGLIGTVHAEFEVP